MSLLAASQGQTGAPARRFPVVSLVLLALGCGDATGPTFTSIGPAGGVATSSDGAVKLTVPAGAVLTPQQFRIRSLTASELSVAPGAIPATAYALEPAGLTLTLPATLSMTLAGTVSTTTPIGELTIVQGGGSGDEERNTTVNAGTRTLTASLDALAVVWVRAAQVARLVVTVESPSITVGEVTRLQAQAVAGDGRVLQREILWSLRSTGIAAIEGGNTVRGLQPGTTWVIAQSEAIIDSVPLRVGARVARIDLTPSGVTLLTGDTVQMKAVAVDPDGIAIPDAPVTFRSSDSTIATVTSTGQLVARQQGAVSVLAQAQNVSATAVLTVEDAATIVRITDLAGTAVSLTSASGVLITEVRVSAAATLRDLLLRTSCGSGSTLTAAGAPDSRGVAMIRVASDSIESSGRAALLNGACTMVAEVTTASGSIRLSRPTSLTLANRSGFTARYDVSGVNAPFGSAFPSLVTIGNVVWRSGSVALELQAKNYENRLAVSAVRGTFLGKAFDAPLSAEGRLTLNFPNVASDPNGRAIGGLVSPVAGSMVVISSATFGDGSVAFTTLDAPPPLFIDNQAPQPVARFALPNANAAIGWIGGSFSFLSSSTFASAGDGAGVGVELVRVYAAPANLPLLGGGTATGSDCVVSGFMRAVSTGHDAINVVSSTVNITNTSIIGRVFEVDRLGNVRCTDLSTGPFGVDVIPPVVVRASTATPDQAIYGFGAPKPPFRFNVIASDAHSGLADPRRVWRQTIGWKGTQGMCFYGFASGACGYADSPDEISLDASGGLWYDRVYVIDRVGNQSSTLLTRVIAGDDRAYASWTGFPSVWVGGAPVSLTFNALTEFGILGMASVGLEIDFSPSRANMKIEVVNQTLVNDRFGLPMLMQWSGTLTIPAFIRQLQQVNASHAPYDDTGEYSRAYAVLYFLENIARTEYSQFYGLGDKQMPVGYTYFGKGIQQYRVTTPVSSVSNSGAGGGAVALSALLTLDAAAATPFTSVCFYYRKGSRWGMAGCTSAATSGGGGTTRTLDYRIAWNPPEFLGASGAVDIRAIGVNGTGDGLVTLTSSTVTLIP